MVNNNVAMPANAVPQGDFLRQLKESKTVIQWRAVLGHRLGYDAMQQTAVGTRDEAFQLLRDGAPAGPPFH